ncbi:MAG: Asp-tRNA(Asn)/Glu-tRNA(Gln) amidotransferase subunit GatB [Candidatus Pacearchaeota archaeon]|nr:Asp-tRNA(Asn)/Glu-tRNA(Gln) amidotransferase subunit GatB [Candidatus Pacearchaeota archaeon]
MSDIKIGLEIHGYLATHKKLFCKCKASRHSKEKPNTFICPTCTSQPGCKPMLPNSQAIEKIVQVGLMLNCKINTKNLVWNRKHYSWPDLPKGYQDTMSGAYSKPLAYDGDFLGIKILECHLEEDPASWNPETGCIDYNRSGLPLVEIVTSPDFSSSQQVTDWLDKLVLTLSYIKALDKNAGIKADVNISHKSTNFQQRVEIKNLSSIENIKLAIDYEEKRQSPGKVERETRRFDPIKLETIKMRSKEQAADYRFIPDPDLPIIRLDKKQIEQIKKSLPETPEQKLEKLIKKYKIDKKNAEILYKNFELVEFFEKVAEKIPPAEALSWVTIELLRVLNWNKASLEQVDIKPEHFIELLELVKKNKLTELKAKSLLNDFVPNSLPPSSRLKQAETISNRPELDNRVAKVIEKNPQAAEDFLAGKKEALNFLIGEIMKSSNRRADFKTSLELLKKKLKK